MWYDEGIAEYADINYEINRMYCEQNGIEIIRSNERNYADRKKHWERLPFIISQISKYDYVIWIDADAHFYLESPSIKNVIATHSDKEMILSGDMNFRNDCDINTGFLILKNMTKKKKIV